jgi:hypothetical protein
LRCIIRSLIWNLSIFLIYALMAINFPLKTGSRIFKRRAQLEGNCVNGNTLKRDCCISRRNAVSPRAASCSKEQTWFLNSSGFLSCL